ncbi:MAG: glycosyltransferase [Spartobacteria bacterium]|nr:glycosyltransferase [Spartobacteria bacterium]
MKVAFCAPFYGSKAAGGAEAECRVTAEKLQQAGVHVEVFSTCLIDLQHDWNINAYPAGTSVEQGVTVHRFPAEKTCKPRFAQLNKRLLNGETLSPDEELQYMSLSIVSTDLLRALQRQCNAFEWIAFIPYLFGTTFFGIQLMREKSVLIPCLHDEAYARISLFESMFQQAGRIIFHAGAEQQLAHRLYDYDTSKDILLGEGITTEFESDADRFRQKFTLHDPFILCAGRKHASKNTPELIRGFLHYREEHPQSPLQLVLIGPGSVPYPADCGIIDLGYVSVQDKRDAYSAAAIFCQPSLNESFSIVLMEAWDCQTPTLVHAHCAVTREHARHSGGGLFFENPAQCAGGIDYLLTHPKEAHAMGCAGQHYVRSHFAWPHIIQRFKSEIRMTKHSSATRSK